MNNGERSKVRFPVEGARPAFYQRPRRLLFAIFCHFAHS